MSRRTLCYIACSYPIVIRCFHLRANSRGKGRFEGGDGLVRDYLFRSPLTLSILTERRVFPPGGILGGASKQSPTMPAHTLSSMSRRRRHVWRESAAAGRRWMDRPGR